MKQILGTLMAIGALYGTAQAADFTQEQKLSECTLQHDYIMDSDELFACMTRVAGNSGAVSFYRHITTSLGRQLDRFRRELAAAPSPESCREYSSQFLANFPLEEQLKSIRGKMEEVRPELMQDADYTTRVDELQADVFLRLAKIQLYPCEEIQLSVK